MRKAIALLALCGLLTAAGCSSHSAPPSPGKKEKEKAAVQIQSPADGATNVPASAELVLSQAKNQAKAATVNGVELTDAAGGHVDGAMRPDGTSWLPAKALKYATKYTAKVTSTDDKGHAGTATASFTTMAKPSNLVRVSSQLGDGLVYGVGMPVIVNFGSDVAKDQRANVERRLFVTADPPQEGAWNWFNPREVHFRSREYWQANTKLTIRLATGGLPLGGGRYGAADVNVQAGIGAKLVMTVDNATKSMTVTKDDQVLKTMPVSLGKPASPSSSGNMVVMVKNQQEYFDSGTFGIPADSPGGYRTLVYWTQRITWGGQFIHGAPWSVADQGHRNVSHGCTNLSPANAEWLFSETHLGDPVIVKGTERQLDWGDGWTDWNVTWEQYLKGSALPHDAATAGASPAASPT